LGFGVRFADFDNDGWPDIIVANGHVNPQVDGKEFGVSYAERDLLFHNRGDGRFQEIGEHAGPALRVKRVGRGLAIADFDHDGKLDIVQTNLDGSPVLLRNTSATKNNWIAVKVPRGISPRVEVRSGNRVQVQEIRTNASYLSSSEATAHFGLGKVDRVDSIRVKTAGNSDKVVNNTEPNRVLEIQP
jgi:enediyne biosynthesis protein E4